MWMSDDQSRVMVRVMGYGLRVVGRYGTWKVFVDDYLSRDHSHGPVHLSILQTHIVLR